MKKITVNLGDDLSITKSYPDEDADKMYKKIADDLLRQEKQTKDTNKKLVVFACSHCNKLVIKYIVSDKNHDIQTECLFCSGHTRLDKIVKANIKCHECSTKFYVYVDSKIESVNCKKCNAKIPIEYNTKMNQFYSKD